MLGRVSADRNILGWQQFQIRGKTLGSGPDNSDPDPLH